MTSTLCNDSIFTDTQLYYVDAMRCPLRPFLHSGWRGSDAAITPDKRHEQGDTIIVQLLRKSFRTPPISHPTQICPPLHSNYYHATDIWRISMKNSSKCSLAPAESNYTNFLIRLLDLVSYVPAFFLPYEFYASGHTLY
jgi:hypothetical protein